MTDTFSTYHPAVGLAYFAAALAFSMSLAHPIAQAVSVVCAAVYAIELRGAAAFMKSLRYLLPVAALTAALNPLFSHGGATIFLWLPDGNPLTLESILFGLSAAAAITSALLWFACLNEVITSDKLVFLFGRAIPSLALLLSMTLRFVPRFAAKLREISGALRVSGAADRRISARVRRGIAVFSATMTWALECSVETADSMRARGYGKGRRTSFSIYSFTARDRAALVFYAFCTAFVASGMMFGAVDWRYYPTASGELASPAALGTFIVYAALCASPVAINLWEARRWKRSGSAI